MLLKTCSQDYTQKYASFTVADIREGVIQQSVGVLASQLSVGVLALCSLFVTAVLNTFC